MKINVKDIFNKDFPKKNVHYILLAVIIILQLAYTTYLFVCVKQGYHSDEIWSYGASNSHHRPFLNLNEGISVHDPPEIRKANTTNYREWVPGTVMNDFLVVNEGEQFDYESVYFNQIIDYHPPFYYMVLHTICSFFPGKYSRIFAFSINIISLVFTQIFLFRTVSLLCKSRTAGLAASVMYALCLGSHITYIYLRQYSLLPMLFMIYLYLNARLFAEADPGKGFDLKKYMPGIAVVSFLIFYTNYPSIVFVGAFTAAFCAYMLFTKRIKQMFIYGLSETAALFAMFAAYPYSVTNMQINSYPKIIAKPDLYTSVKVFVNYLLSGTLGIKLSVWKSPEARYIPVILLGIILIFAPAAFLFRNDERFRKTAAKAKAIPSALKNADMIPLFTFIASAALIAALIGKLNLWGMSCSAIRYIFMLFPPACLIMICISDAVLRILNGSETFRISVICAVYAFAGIYSNLDYSIEKTYYDAFSIRNGYYYTDISGILKNENCIAVISNDESEVWVMTCYAEYLRYADNIFLTSGSFFEDDFDKITGSGVHVKYAFLPVSWIDMYYDGGYDESVPDIIQMLTELNGGSFFSIRSEIMLQGQPFYLIELSDITPQ